METAAPFATNLCKLITTACDSSHPLSITTWSRGREEMTDSDLYLCPSLKKTVYALISIWVSTAPFSINPAGLVPCFSFFFKLWCLKNPNHVNSETILEHNSIDLAVLVIHTKRSHCFFSRSKIRETVKMFRWCQPETRLLPRLLQNDTFIYLF